MRRFSVKLFSFTVILLFFTSSVQLFSNENSRALILGGGGARGAYQIGVWKALRELDINIGAVYGVSVGSINAAMVTLDAYEKANELWHKLDNTSIMKLDEAGERVFSGKFTFSDFVDALSGFINEGGINVDPLEHLLYETIDEEKVRASNIDFGLMTYSLKDFSDKCLLLDDIPEGRLIDYILASANYPVFKRKIIDGEEFIDGGVSRNIVLDMVDPEIYKNVIVVSLGMYSPKEIIDYYSDYSDYGFKVKFISPRHYAGAALEFSPENADRLILMGYLDCLSAYGKIHGSKYYIKGDPNILEKLYLKLTPEERFNAADLLNIDDIPDLSFFERENSFHDLIEPEIRRWSDDDIEFLERAARLRRLEKERLYSTEQMLSEITFDYIHRWNNSIYYNRYLDFLSYLYLESAY